MMDAFNLDIRRAHCMGKRLQVFPTLYGPGCDFRTSKEVEVVKAVYWLPRDRRRSYDGLCLSTKRRRNELKRLGIL